jgi:photosystem II stability/assembly factor-like uncharacterized protein
MKRISVVLCMAAALACMAALAPAAQALAPDGSQGWFWQMPQPAGLSGYGALAFPDASHLWAVGNGGLVLSSSDAGATWAAQTAPTNADLSSVSFPDATHGWACGTPPTGAGSVILATTDGGTTWLDKTPAGLKVSPTNASFVDDLHGWVGTSGGEILKTVNGGDTWQTLNLPGAMAGIGGVYVTVDFIDANQGWAAMGGQLWMTFSGGKTWMPLFGGLSPDLAISQIDFTDPIHGWLLAYSQFNGATQVLKTDNGGFSWRAVATGDTSVSALDVTSASSVWLVGSGSSINPFFFSGLFGGTSSVVVQHSRDGGAHWQSSSLGSPFYVGAIAARGTTVCAAGEGILTSSDTGATWQSASSGQQYQFTAATAVSAGDVWATDASGALLHSTDGVRWAENASPKRWAGVLYGVSFPDASDGWVVGANDQYGDGSVILHSSDGGATWNPQASNLSSGLDGVDFVDADNGWAVGSPGFGFGFGQPGAPLSLERTTDGGVTWVPQYVVGNPNLVAVDFISATTGWAAGYLPSGNGTLPGIFATTNGGVTWTKEKVPAAAQSITDVQFLDASDGWAVGTSYDQNFDYPQQGWVLHTTDGGATWVRVPGLTDSLSTTVHFSDATHGWIGGLNGVYATTDGGTSWQRVAGGEGVTAIAATDPDHVWAFGDGFLVSPLHASADTAAPVTLIDNYRNWYRRSATISLSANDVGGSGVASTTYSSDGGTTWQTGTGVAIDAPADHSNDGFHSVLYRSTDTSGNQEATEDLTFGIDTLGPACSVPRPAIADTGKMGTLYFLAADATSDIAQATVSISNSHGRVLRRFVERPGDWDWSPAPPYDYLRFRCTLKPGAYRVEVRATDGAGNSQVVIGHGRLRVVRHGAPAFHNPGWPAGLPGSSLGFASRVSHSVEAQRLLRLRATWPGAWRVPFLSGGRP